MAQNEKFKSNAEKYTKYVGIYKGNYLLKNEVNASNREIKLTYAGSSLTEDDKESITNQSNLFSLNDAKISIEQGLTIDVDLSDVEKKLNVQSEETNLRQEIARLNLVISNYKQKFDSIQNRLAKGKQLLAELTPIFPDIEDCSYSDTYVYSKADSISQNKVGIFTISSKNKYPRVNKKK